MKKEVGLWIDHTRAVLVISLDQEEVIKELTSNTGKRVRQWGASHASGTGESHNDIHDKWRDRRSADRLNRYYDEIILYLRDAISILIIGPGEAKNELQKRLESHNLSDRITAVKLADKMTRDQLAAEVRQHFREKEHDANRTI